MTVRRYMQTLPCWSISLEVSGIGLLQSSFLAINSIEISIIQHRKTLVTKLLDYFSVGSGVIKPGFSEPGFQISALFLCFLMRGVTIVHKNSQLKQKRCQTDKDGDMEVLKSLLI